MSEPPQPPVPPTTPPEQPAPPSPHADPALPAAPQHPSNGSYPPAAAPYPANASSPQAAPQGASHPGAAAYAAPQPPYGTAPTAYGAPADTAPSTANPLGRLAFIIALASLALRVLSTVIMPFLAIGSGYTLYGVMTAVFNLLVLGAAAAALVLGFLAIRRRGPLLLAGIAIGVGGSQVVLVVFGWLSSLFFYL
ncbi:hypothetical protein [Microbacterium sp. 179-I 3D4 NHS]|uniref:hypothetical protein n=1 Tax=Microbacterium sp. 179-I 3D4 NHS TaxID=3142381 RepID=UPI0039A0F51B